MPGEKQISMNWRNNIDELVSLPGENAPSFNNAWEKLELRLQQGKKQRKVYWYWAAAACIIACFMAIWLKENNKTGKAVEPVVKDFPSIHKKETAPVITNETRAIKKENIVTALPPFEQKQKTGRKINPVRTTDTTSVVTLIAKNTDSINSTVGITNIVANSQTIKQKLIVFNALKKKLPVVHINDIEKPVATNESVAGNNEHSFKLRLFRRDISTSSPGEVNDNNGIFRIKIPPQN